MDSRSDSQNDFVTRLNEGFAAIAGWSFDHRWCVVRIALWSLAAALFLVV